MYTWKRKRARCMPFHVPELLLMDLEYTYSVLCWTHWESSCLFECGGTSTVSFSHPRYTPRSFHHTLSALCSPTWRIGVSLIAANQHTLAQQMTKTIFLWYKKTPYLLYCPTATPLLILIPYTQTMYERIKLGAPGAPYTWMYVAIRAVL